MAKGPGLLHYTAHRALALGEHLQILSKRHVRKWHLRYKTSDISETKWSRAKVTTECQ